MCIQVISKREAERVGVVPGSRVVERRRLTQLQRECVQGLVMLEGSMPPCHLNPLLHRVVHYAVLTAIFGCMEWMAMWAFERYNKRMKSLIRNSRSPLESMENNIKMDIATRFLEWAKNEVHRSRNERIGTCTCYGRPRVCAYVRIDCL